MNKIDIQILDNINPHDPDAADTFEQYSNGILKQFRVSTEGKEYLKIDKDMGFWSERFIDFAYHYTGVSLQNVEIVQVDEILNDIFPRKITIQSPDEADSIVQELIVFWEYLKRDYKLKNANRILQYLEEIKLNYYNTMNDESKFGMAKSFIQLGKEAGFDMHNEKDMLQFAKIYNASLSSKEVDEKISNRMNVPKNKNRNKRLRKLEKKSRKKNRKK